MKKMFVLLFFCATHTFAQTDWTQFDFIKECKVDTKFPGSVAKSFRENPIFINDYTIIQASLMRGKSQSGVMQKQGVGNAFSEAALAGVSQEALQALINDLHKEFVAELKAAGLNVTDGDELIASDYAKSKAGGKNVIIGKTDGTVVFDKVGPTNPMAYDVKETNIFRPKDVNVFVNPGAIGGNFYGKLSIKENVNLISIAYQVRFATFEGSKTMTRNTIETKAGLSITPVITIINPKGAFSWIAFKKAVWGNNHWSKGLVTEGSFNGSLLGLASKGEYAIHADEAAYIQELRDIVSNLQKDLVAHIKAQL